MKKITKKQIKLNKKLRYMKTAAYAKEQKDKAEKMALDEAKIRAKDRDGWKCAVCEDTKLPNTAHIIPEQIKEFKTDLMNLITLCPKHHNFSFNLSSHNGSFAFVIWLKENRPVQYEYLEEKIKKMIYDETIKTIPG